MTTFDEWNNHTTKTFIVPLTNDEGISMDFTFKKNPSIGDYEIIMNQNKKGQGGMMISLIHRLLMKPIISHDKLRTMDGVHLTKLFEGINDNIKLPSNLTDKLKHETLNNGNKSEDNGNSNEGTAPTPQ